MENGADELLRESCRPAASTFGTDGEIIARTIQLVVVIGTPVDEFLGPSMTIFEKAVEQISPHLRDGAPGRPAEHGLSGHDRLCRPAPCRARLSGRRGLLPGADRRGPCPRGAPHAAPDHRRRHRRGGRARAKLCSRCLAAKTIRTTTKEAELAKLFTNTWRYMKFAVANQFFMIADQAGVDYTNVLHAIRDDYPRAADLPGPGLRRRSVPVQGHDAARRVHGRPLPARPGRDAGQRGPAGLHRVGARTALRRPERQDRRDPRDGVQGRVRRPARLAQLQASQAPRWAGRPGRSRRTRTSATIASCPRQGPRGERHPDPRRTAPAYRGLQVGGKDVVDVWGALGEGIRL